MTRSAKAEALRRSAAVALAALAFTAGGVAQGQEAEGPLRFARPGEAAPAPAAEPARPESSEAGEPAETDQPAAAMPDGGALRFGGAIIGDGEAAEASAETDPVEAEPAEAAQAAAEPVSMPEEPPLTFGGTVDEPVAADDAAGDEDPGAEEDTAQSPAVPDLPDRPDAEDSGATGLAEGGTAPAAEPDEAAAAEAPDGAEITGATPGTAAFPDGEAALAVPGDDSVERIVEPAVQPSGERIRSTLRPDPAATAPELPARPAAPLFQETVPEPEDPTVRLGIVLPALGRAAAAPGAFEALSPLRDDLSRALDRPVEFVPMVSYRALVDAQVWGRIDGGFFSSAAFAAAEARCGCLEPLVAPASDDGSTAYSAILVTRRGSGIESLDGLAGKIVAVGPEDSIAARLVPYAELSGRGIDPERFFGEVVETASPVDGVRMVLGGTADAAFGWSAGVAEGDEAGGRGTLADLARFGVEGAAELAVTWRSQAISHGPVAVRDTLGRAEKEAIAGVLERLDPEESAPLYDMLDPIYGGGLRAVDASDYRGIAAIVEPRETR